MEFTLDLHAQHAIGALDLEKLASPSQIVANELLLRLRWDIDRLELPRRRQRLLLAVGALENFVAQVVLERVIPSRRWLIEHGNPRQSRLGKERKRAHE